ncbi:hypothetical protein [Chitinophaga sp. RAB17]|uniref:hypothetical protein n=1 Tax=Chitinophaga sp. RAB17 TaxID=3233049 RepID=UPI003F92C8FA
MKNRDQESSPLLQYTISTNPSPVNISSGNNTVTAQIIIQVGADQDVLCKYISIGVPVGDGSDDMYSVSPLATSSCDNPDWEISTDNIHGMTDENGSTKNFLYKHISDDMTVSTDVTFTINGTVNSESGTATIQINEYAMGINDDNYMKRQKSQDIAKAAEESFFLNSLVLEYLDTPGVPVTLIDKTRGVQLIWQSNGDYFKVYSGSGLDPVYKGSGKSYAMPEGLTSDLALIVEADKDGDVLYQEYVIKVSSPMLTVSTLEINESLVGSVGMFTSNQMFFQGWPASGYFTPTSDGFVTFQISASDLPFGGMIFVRLCLSETFGYTFTTFSSTQNSTQNSMTVPVQKGVPFWLVAGQVGENATYGFNASWIPLGQGTIQSGGSPEAIAKLKTFSEQLNKDIISYQRAQKQKATDFITALENAFDKTLKEEVKERLIEKYL